MEGARKGPIAQDGQRPLASIIQPRQCIMRVEEDLYLAVRFIRGNDLVEFCGPAQHLVAVAQDDGRFAGEGDGPGQRRGSQDVSECEGGRQRRPFQAPQHAVIPSLPPFIDPDGNEGVANFNRVDISVDPYVRSAGKLLNGDGIDVIRHAGLPD